MPGKIEGEETRLKDETEQRSSKGKILLEAKGVSKGFPGVWEHLILDHIDFDVRAGEVHTLLGENGAGKTVIANILSGFYLPSSGHIYVKGKEVFFKSPRDGLAYGIGMVHQELMLVRPFTVAQNVALGLSNGGFTVPLSRIEQKLRELSERFGLKVDPSARIEDLSAGEQQRVEIMKVLYHNPEVLILDEPTSLLTPEEADSLFAVLRGMTQAEYGIVFITHKMKEVMKVSDRVTVLKLGKMVGTTMASETSEAELTQWVFGKHTPIHLERETNRSDKVVMEIQGVHALGAEHRLALRGVSFNLHAGEIFGIAGVAGNGQSELVEVVTGLRQATQGRVTLFGKDMTNRSPRKFIEAGVSHIPEKRREAGVIEGMTVAENVMLKDYRTSPFSSSGILRRARITEHSRELISNFKAIVPDLWRTETRILSGGNIQRLILARETWRRPRVLIAVHPTEGLDTKAINQTWNLFMSLREEGSAILLVSEDLDEVMSLSDRIGVMFEGEMVAIVEGKGANRAEVGSLMAGVRS